jgi:hypothetical protein
MDHGRQINADCQEHQEGNTRESADVQRNFQSARCSAPGIRTFAFIRSANVWRVGWRRIGSEDHLNNERSLNHVTDKQEF